MKKRNLMKLTLNKETIASLNRIELNESLGGARPSRIGVSCYTGHCCYSKKECEILEPETIENC
jgi:hypothetical protein